MKRILSLILSCTMLITGCGLQNTSDALTQSDADLSDTTTVNDVVETEGTDKNQNVIINSDPGDPEVLSNMEDLIYDDLIDELNSDSYFVENVKAVYISNEYLEELEYNSKSNIFFGYSLEQIDEQFQGTRYVFTLGDDGQTIVKQFEKYDDTYEQVIKNVAIGAGVILICVTVSFISGKLGASTISICFARSATNGTVNALKDGSSEFINSFIVSTIDGVENDDYDKVLKAAALAGSNKFKWGAIEGVLSGDTKDNEIVEKIKGKVLKHLKLDDAAKIQNESKYPLDVINNISSVDEYSSLKSAGLKPSKVNKKSALIKNIDWDYIGDIIDGRTNEQRVSDGLSPLDDKGKPYVLYHIGQNEDSPIAVLTEEEYKKQNEHIASCYEKEDTQSDCNKNEDDSKLFWTDLLNKQR